MLQDEARPRFPAEVLPAEDGAVEAGEPVVGAEGMQEPVVDAVAGRGPGAEEGGVEGGSAELEHVVVGGGLGW